MRCIICDGPSAHYFTKTYTQEPFASFMADIGPVDYWRCGACGFTQSKTHVELPRETWERLNHQFHSYTNDPAAPNLSNPAPIDEQALFVARLLRNGLAAGPVLDYAGGSGTLSTILERYLGISAPIFDPYMGDQGSRYVQAVAPGSYGTVINSAMFEHVVTRADLDAVNAAVADDGVMIIHTVICERVPPDPDWFYLVPPVHIAFHTNASMEILMRQWGYKSSIYCPKAKSWALLKCEVAAAEPAVAAINREIDLELLIAKSGFVDYWKGF